jgi:unsaturated rhamnogalacturonyl hydrolase
MKPLARLMNFVRRILHPALLLASICALQAANSAAAEPFDIGLAASGKRIDAVAVEARSRDPMTVALIGGLQGEDGSSAAVRAAVATYEQKHDRKVRLLAVPVANPDGVALQFPPTGVAYREHAESHALWRWLGVQAPDLVLIAGDQDYALAEALGTQKVADMGRIPARRWAVAGDWKSETASIGKSEAHRELEQRRARTPRQFAQGLARYYGRDFDQPLYIGAIALIARMRLGETEDVRRIVEPWVNGSKDLLARPSALVMAGHIVFTELSRRTGDPRYLAAVRRVADLGFDASGKMLEAMPYHDGYSDSVFMGTAILAQAGALTGERRYFDMADRHLRFMQNLDLRPDGLYRHRPEADVPWGRGNGFAALGLALTLSELPVRSAGRAHALQSYREFMATLLPLQTRDGLWRNVINHPGAYAEVSGTAMIGFALRRGLERGWIRGDRYRRAVANAWLAVNSRTSASGGFVDVCESTARFTSLEEYLHRAAILGEDARGGAMALLFATELMEKRQ